MDPICINCQCSDPKIHYSNSNKIFGCKTCESVFSCDGNKHYLIKKGYRKEIKDAFKKW